MAAKATIYKALLNIANMDSHYYAEHNLTMAKHPSETDLRLMIRLVAFILNADEGLEFCKGISQEDEPDLWKKSLGGEITLWIEELAKRAMSLQANISDNELTLTDDEYSVVIREKNWMR